MEIVLQIAARLALAVRQVERDVDIDVPEAFTFLHNLLELAIVLIEEWPLCFTRWGTGGSHEDYGAVRVLFAQAGEVLTDARDRGFDRIARVDIVAAALEDHDARVIGQRDAVHVAVDFGGERAAEAAVDHRVGLHLLGDILPHA